MRLVWRSLPSQLAKENKKFIYSAVRPSGRARDFEGAIQWLADADLAIKVPRVSKPGIPLDGYEDFSAFKLFMHDVGLFGAKSGLSARALIGESGPFTEFKGSLTEQYVCQQLVAGGVKPRYWSVETSAGEVDFLIERDGMPVPVEVKAEENLKAKSLKAFCAKYGLNNAVRTSMSPYRREEWLENLPLYAINLACG